MSPGVLRIELRRSVALLLFPLLLAAAWWTSWQHVSAEVPGPRTGVYVWQYTSEALQMAALFVGPLVAGLSAWVAGRDRRRGTDELLATTARPSALRALATWAGTALWGVAAYVLVVAGLLCLTWWSATWGAPLFGYLLVGLLALTADSAIGFAAGHWFPSRFTAPLAAVGLWLGHIMPLGGTSLGARFELLSPATYGYLGGNGVFYEVPPGSARQALFFAGLCGVGLTVIALGDHGARRLVRAALGISIVVTIVGATTALALQDQHLMPTTADGRFIEPKAAPFKPACEEDRITVCVHPAYEKLLPEAVRTVNEVAEPIIGVSGVPTRIVQANGPKTVSEGAKAKDAALFGGFDPRGNVYREDVASGLVQSPELSYGPNTPNHGRFAGKDLQRCGEGMRHKNYFDPAYEAQAVVGRWLVHRAGGRVYEMSSGCPNADELDKEFASLASAERRAWLEKNLAGLRAGEVTLKDLP